MSASKAARDALEARRQRKLEALRAARDDELALLPQADGGQAKAVEAKYEQQRLMTIRMFAPLLSRFDDAVFTAFLSSSSSFSSSCFSSFPLVLFVVFASSIAFAFALATLAWTFSRTSSSEFFIDTGGVSDDDDDDDEEESDDVVITARRISFFVRLVKAPLVLRVPGSSRPSRLHLSRTVIATWKDWTKEARICVSIYLLSR